MLEKKSLYEKTREFLRKTGLTPQKKMGQSFIINQDILDYEISILKPYNKKITEIGPGPGFTTGKILEYKPRQLIVIEKDRVIFQYLVEMLRDYNNIEMFNKDVLSIEKHRTEYIFTNLPYKISSPFISLLTCWDFETAVIMLQKEFGERLIAKPGDKNFCHLSVFANRYFKIFPDRIINRKNFYPEPAVDSMIIKIKPRGVTVDPAFHRFTALLFMHKNQTVKNSLIHSRKAFKIKKSELSEFINKKLKKFASKRVRFITLQELEEIYCISRNNHIFPCHNTEKTGVASEKKICIK